MCESVCETWEVREIIANLEVACGGMCRGYRQSDFWVLVAVVRVVRLCGRFREKRGQNGLLPFLSKLISLLPYFPN